MPEGNTEANGTGDFIQEKANGLRIQDEPVMGGCIRKKLLLTHLYRETRWPMYKEKTKGLLIQRRGNGLSIRRKSMAPLYREKTMAQ